MTKKFTELEKIEWELKRKPHEHTMTKPVSVSQRMFL